MERSQGTRQSDALTRVLEMLLAIIEEQAHAIHVAERAANDWQRKAVLSTATVANDLGLRVREAESRERLLRAEIADLAKREGRVSAQPHLRLKRSP